MKPSKEKLYDALGELIYAVAFADGAVQPSETEKLKEMLLAHPWASNIQWSFDYEQGKKHSVEEAYRKALDTCKDFGPTPEYEFLFEVLNTVAKASDGMDTNELEVIERFKRELKEHFIEMTDDQDSL